MSCLIAVVVLAASPTPVRVAAPGLQVVNLEPKLAEFYTEHVAQQLTYGGLQVITAREISSLLGLERQRQLLGCGVNSCMAELANAFGADAVLLGDIARLGDTYQVNLKLIGANDGRSLALFSKAVSSESALLEALATAGRQMARDAHTSLGRPPPVSLEERQGPRRWAWLPLSIGAATLVAGAICLGVSLNARSQLSTGTPGADGLQLKSLGETTEPLAVVGLGLGAAALAGAAVLFFLGSDAQATPSVALTGHGASFGLVGVWP